jgi:cytochrome c5
MKNLVMGLLFLSLTACLSSCGLNSDKSSLAFKVPKAGSNEIIVNQETDTQFLAIRKNLIDVSCLKCHNEKQTRHSNLTSRAVVLENADDMLYRMTDAWGVGEDKMPPRGDAVSPAVIKEFRAWKSDTTFANLQKKLFEVSCLKCHGATQTRHSNLTSKDVVLEHYDDVIYKMTKAFDEGNKPMPPVGKGTKVSAELIQELQNWKESL